MPRAMLCGAGVLCIVVTCCVASAANDPPRSATLAPRSSSPLEGARWRPHAGELATGPARARFFSGPRLAAPWAPPRGPIESHHPSRPPSSFARLFLTGRIARSSSRASGIGRFLRGCASTPTHAARRRRRLVCGARHRMGLRADYARPRLCAFSRAAPAHTGRGPIAARVASRPLAVSPFCHPHVPSLHQMLPWPLPRTA
jgi:hypothetical protein